MGDSAAEACPSSAAARTMVKADIHGIPQGSWCNAMNECEVDYRGYTGIFSINATFRSLGEETWTDIHVHATKVATGTAYYLGLLERGREGDVFVINQGLHYSNPGEQKSLLDRYRNRMMPTLLSAKDRGARVVWRETSVAHFNTTDAQYAPDLVNLQMSRSARCIPASLINVTSSREPFNGALVPLMRSASIPVFEVWRASFLAPGWCHIGGGKDCTHFLQPGATSFFTEALLKYIEKNA